MPAGGATVKPKAARVAAFAPDTVAESISLASLLPPTPASPGRPVQGCASIAIFPLIRCTIGRNFFPSLCKSLIRHLPVALRYRPEPSRHDSGFRDSLGAGGMGQVYQAQDTKLKRVVAIKRMAPRLQQNDQDRRRFLREAQQASALNHPNIASIYDVIEEQGEIFLIMEYVEGTPLRSELLMEKDYSLEQFFKVAAQGLEGLNAAHEKGILHGDIEPENIMLTPEGRVKVLDFGVARRFSLGEASANSNDATMTAILRMPFHCS